MPDLEEFTRTWWPLTQRLARATHFGNVDDDDVASDAALGLVNAARTFDPERGTPAGAWVTTCVQRAIIDGVRTRQGRPGSLKNRTVLHSLDAPTPHEGLSYADRLPDPDPTPQDLAVAADATSAAATTRAMLTLLPPRERHVLTETLAHGRTLADVGAELGLTESRIGQIRAAALEALRRPRTCHYCGAPYTPLSWRSRFCRDACRSAAYQARLNGRRRCKDGIWRYRPRPCARCGDDFRPTDCRARQCPPCRTQMPAPRSCAVCRGTLTHLAPTAIYCSPGCYSTARHDSQRPPVAPRPCEECRTWFTPTRRNARFCQHACYQRLYYRTRYAARAQAAGQRAAARRGLVGTPGGPMHDSSVTASYPDSRRGEVSPGHDHAL